MKYCLYFCTLFAKADPSISISNNLNALSVSVDKALSMSVFVLLSSIYDRSLSRH